MTTEEQVTLSSAPPTNTGAEGAEAATKSPPEAAEVVVVEELHVSTHVLVPETLLFKLRELAQRTRIHQSVYLRECVDDLLRKYTSGVIPPQPLAGDGTSTKLESVVFRVAKSALESVKALAKSTRIRQSELLREALHDLLVKYQDKLAVPE